MNHNIYKYLFIFALTILFITCKDVNTAGNQDNENLQLAETAIDIFQNRYSVQDSSIVFLVGPLESGTILRENTVVENNPIQLEIPDEDGTYYVFMIDDEPNKYFEHDVRYGWVEIDSEESSIMLAKYPIKILRPNKEPEPFQLDHEFTNDNINYYYLSGEGGEDTQDISNKADASTTARFYKGSANIERTIEKSGWC